MTLYTCPMHPEVIKNGPGSCPICGMALEAMLQTIAEKNSPELIDMTWRFWISVILTLPILLLTMGGEIPGITYVEQRIPLHWMPWIQCLLATPVTLGCGWPLLKKGVISIIHRKLNMFTLIALGITVAYGYSLIALLFPKFFPAAFYSKTGEINLYFEAASVITTLVLMGQVLELRAREKTGSALRSLLDLAPKMAYRVNSKGLEKKIPLEEVEVNDILRIRPGEKIPVDGIIKEGNSVIDESMVTGESIPVEKKIHSNVIGGTLNISGSFLMQALRVGQETLLSQMVQQVANAQRSRAPIQKLADLVSSYFVPVVVLVAIITFFVWAFFGPNPSMIYGLISAISVLIIACPCALGLATPMSVMVGMGRGAQAGILIKNAESLERFEKVDVLVVDKTGTLTEGKPIVKSIISFSDSDQKEVLRLAASLEMNSEHPLANAIVEAAKQQRVSLSTVTHFSADFGKGVSGIIDNQSVALGNAQLLKSMNIQENISSVKAEELRKKGETVMFVVSRGQVLGIISVADPIKKTTPKALNALRKEGLSIVMITGDNRTTAEAVARTLNINEVEAEILPAEKHEIIEHLKAEGNSVAMAGDGVNDAAALAAADVGIAMGNGTDIAKQSANITLVKGDLMGIVRARQLSQTVMKNIRQNLFLAFAYNVVCIPIAAGVLYPWTETLLNPMIAAAAMSLSSVSVILNSLRLRRISFI